MINKIKIALVVIALISGAILAVLFLQDRTKKLEDRKYKEISSISLNTDLANVNFYKSEDENVRVVVFGSSKDTVEIIEGSMSLTISKKTGNTTCYLNCKNEVNIYIPEKEVKIDVKSEKGNITSDTYISNLVINSDIGNVNLSKVGVLDVVTNIGDVVVSEIGGNFNSNIKTDVGNVLVGTIINLYIDAKSEVGSVVIPVVRDTQEFTLKIETNKGNVEIEHHENKSE